MDPTESAVFKVISADTGNGAFGTAFAIAREGATIWLLTCAQVLHQVKRPVIGTLPARPIADGVEQGIDLAVLAVDGLADAPLLSHWIEGREGDRVHTRGYSRIDPDRSATEKRRLDGRLGQRVLRQQQDRPGEARVWDLEIGSDDFSRLKSGFSGAPLYDDEHRVVAVVSERCGGERGHAVCLSNLQIVCEALWQRRDPADPGRRITRAAYQDADGVDGILKTYFTRRMDRLDPAQRDLASRAFDFLVSEHGANMAYPLPELGKLIRQGRGPWREALHQGWALLAEALGAQLRGLWRLGSAASETGNPTPPPTDDPCARPRLRDTEGDGLLTRLSRIGEQRLRATLDCLSRHAILRRANRQGRAWYELCRDLFAKPIAERNQAQKRRRLRRRTLAGTLAALAAALMIGAAGIAWEASRAHLRLSPLQSLSNRIEVYRGDAGVWDPFGQQVFLYETGYLRCAIEPDKRVFPSPIARPADTRAGLIGRLPLEERFPEYASAGLLDRGFGLGDQILASRQGHSGLVDQLSGVRVDKAVQTLGARLDGSAPEDEELGKQIGDALLALGSAEATSLYPTDGPGLDQSPFAPVFGWDRALGMKVFQAMISCGTSAERRFAVQALVTLGAREQVAAIAERLEDQVWNVRQVAVQALAALGAREQAAAIAGRLEDQDSDVRWIAVQALAVLDVRERTAAIAGRPQDPDGEIRRSAVQALGGLRIERQTERLRRLLVDEAIAANAAEALSRLGWTGDELDRWQRERFEKLAEAVASPVTLETAVDRSEEHSSDWFRDNLVPPRSSPAG